MKRLVKWVLAVAVVAAAIIGMAELTQNRPDVVQAGSRTTISFTVADRDVQRGERAAAGALWAVCAGTVGGEVSPAPTPSGDEWHVTIEPAIGEHGENRLVGCLEDVTIDRVIGDVVDIRHRR